MCATMYRIDLAHLCWSLENLAAGTPVNVIEVDDETASWSLVALGADAGSRLILQVLQVSYEPSRSRQNARMSATSVGRSPVAAGGVAAAVRFRRFRSSCGRRRAGAAGSAA